MNKLFFLILLILFGYLQMLAQVPEGFNYQAVARDATGNVRMNETINVRFTLQPGVSAAPTWIETQTAQTDDYGVFTLTIGNGTKVGGSASSFKNLDFSGGDYWIQVEVKDGSNYLIVGAIQKFLSVPYALIAKKSLTAVNDLDTNATNELQILKLSNDTLYLDRGGFVFLGYYYDKKEILNIKTKIIADSSYLKGLLNNKQSVLTAGAGITISASNVIKATDSSSTNELQTLSIRNDTIFLTNGGFVKLPANGGGTAHYIGELFGGGVVFYVDKTGSHGLICSMIDLNTTIAWTKAAYYTTSVPTPGALSDWNGQTNTTAIVSQAGTGSTYAAGLCDAYTNANYGTGVYSDWYLPAIHQLYKLWGALYEVNNALDTDGNAATKAIIKDLYLSSSEFSNYEVMFFQFLTGNQTNWTKDEQHLVRAIRYF